jgi:hypothetical protein
MKRKAKVTGNEAVWEWFMNARSNNIHMSGPMVQSEALAVAKSLGNHQFKVSIGWLVSFKKKTILCGTESVEKLKKWTKM